MLKVFVTALLIPVVLMAAAVTVAIAIGIYKGFKSYFKKK